MSARDDVGIALIRDHGVDRPSVTTPRWLAKPAPTTTAGWLDLEPMFALMDVMSCSRDPVDSIPLG